MKDIFFCRHIQSTENDIITSLSIPATVLMENAGANSAKYILENYKDLIENEVAIIAGKGNNAGDGFVIARHLANHGVHSTVLCVFNPHDFTGDGDRNFYLLINLNSNFTKIIYCKDLKTLTKNMPSGKGLIIDAIFGTGFKGEPDENMKSIVNYLNGIGNKFRICIDVPSGLSSCLSKVTVKADLTLSMGVKKFETLFYEGKVNSGKVEVINIGIPDDIFNECNGREIYETEKNDIRKFIPVRKLNSNKYENGKLFILTGSIGLTGASYLCSMSAMRAGCGAVVAGVPEQVNDILEIKLTEVMTEPLPGTSECSLALKSYEFLKSRLHWADVVLIGPGLSKNSETAELVRKIVKENDLKFVIDADGINAFKGHINILKNKKIILTPHTGEFANLLEITSEQVRKNFYELATKFAAENKIVLVLKNSTTLITNGEQTFINPTGRENLATAGSGDVLSGIIASLYSQGTEILQSAVAGCYLHGMCGDNLYEKSGGNSTIAGDLINEISKVKNELVGK